MAQRGVLFSVGALVVAGGVLWWPASNYLKKQAVANYFERSEALTKDGRWEDAKVELKKAIEIDPDYVEARDALATLMTETGYVDEAKQLYNTGIARLPKNKFLIYGAAMAMFSAQRFEESLAYSAAGEKVDPGSRDFAYVHALALEKLGRMDEAHMVYVKALEAHPGDTGLERSANRTTPEGIKKQQELKEAKKKALKIPKQRSVSTLGKSVPSGAMKAMQP